LGRGGGGKRKKIGKSPWKKIVVEEELYWERSTLKKRTQYGGRWGEKKSRMTGGGESGDEIKGRGGEWETDGRLGHPGNGQEGEGEKKGRNHSELLKDRTPKKGKEEK